MKTIEFKTKKENQILDITDDIHEEIKKASHKNGVCHLFLQHTSAALSTADLDPGTDLDMLEAFNKMIPKLKFRHPHDPSHVPDHILSTIIGSDLSIPFTANKPLLGTWQRIVLIEFDGPKSRSIVVTLNGA